jgi:hypothetical protein
MQIDLVQLTNEWTPFTDITTPETNVKYEIQNRGADPVIALESATIPTSDITDGTVIYPTKNAIYTKGSQTLYLKAFFSSSTINVTKVG